MQQSKPILLTHTKSGCIVTTDGQNLTTGEQTDKPIRGKGEYTIPAALNAMCETNENLKELVLILGLAIER